MANWIGTAIIPAYNFDGSSLTIANFAASINNISRATITSSVTKVETVSLKTRPTSGQLFPR